MFKICEKIRTIRALVQAMRSDGYIGDVAILKLTIMVHSEGPNPFRQEALRLKAYNFEILRVAELERFPAGSFGRAYFDFMSRSCLKPLNFSESVAGIFERFPVSIRYARVHDMVHVLLGFEADLAGELGVYSFVHQQGYSSHLKRAYHTGRVVARIIKPWAWTGQTHLKPRPPGPCRGSCLTLRT